jgi:hypothetical protein
VSTDQGLNSSPNPEAGIQIMAAQSYKKRLGHQPDLEQDHFSGLAQRSLSNPRILRHRIQVVPRVNPSDSNVGFGEVNMNQQR